MDDAQINAVFVHMYGGDPGVADDEMQGLALWCAERPGEPCGGSEFVQRVRRLIRARGTKIRTHVGGNRMSRPSRQVSSAQAAENARQLLGDRVLRLDDLIDASPIPIHWCVPDLLAGFGLLCRHLYHPDDRIVVVSRAFWPKQDFDGKWQPCGYGETWKAGVWAQWITVQAVVDGCARRMPPDTKLTAEERHPVDGSPARQEGGIPLLEMGHWWACTRWGAWFRCNPVTTYEGSGKYGAHTDKDVARYLYLLMENDRLPLETQVSVVAALGLPVAAATSSGRRGVHLLIALNASNETQFRRMTAQVYQRLAPYGFDQTGNPSRMTRMPGVLRRDEHPTTTQRETMSAAQNQHTFLLGKQLLLWLSNDHRGALLPW